jgi:hypothetical protein
VHWIAASIAILLVDLFTGPFIQFPILFVVPVALATASHGRIGGVVVAVVLPLARLSFFLHWPLPSSWFVEGIDTAVDMAILTGFSLLIEHLLQQQREIRVLQGMLPICAFCKKIRDEAAPGGSSNRLSRNARARVSAIPLPGVWSRTLRRIGRLATESLLQEQQLR